MTTFYAYITDHCKSDIEKHSVTSDIEKLAAKIERDQSDRGLDHYPPPYRKKCIGRPGRLIIEECRRGDDIVLCFVRYLTRGSAEYTKEFLGKTSEFYDRYKVPDAEIEKFLLDKRLIMIPRKPELSAGESVFLSSGTESELAEDGGCLESYDWFERISQEWAQPHLSRYFDLIEKIHFGGDDEEERVIACEKHSHVKILFKRFPQYRRTFLIAPINPKIENDEKHLIDKYAAIFSHDNVGIEELLRRSRRAYPSIITCDEQLWFAVENSVEANLALSPEEESILDSVMISSPDQAKFPLFINGRPGSGKSTILQYLFAELLTRYVNMRDDLTQVNPPLYLTYSNPLLEQAKSAVENIFKCGARDVMKAAPLSDTDFASLTRSCFRNFRDFLRSLLPSDSRGQFTHGNYIDFDRFKSLWNSKRSKHPENQVREISSELAWHAIRTFIKGMQHEPGSILDPEFYAEELPRDMKSISDAMFCLIYDQVWQKWYEPLCNEHDYWDDQDLARTVLANAENDLPEHLAVFCDEAQDFTRIELELIQRLSVYANRNIPKYLVKSVPYAFAGDPFQTLNPTGFNWNTMQSSFHENIVKQLDPDGSARLEFNFQELAFNYRSSEHIVRLANLIQLLRAVLLGLKGLKPQHCWSLTRTTIPVWFRLDDASFQSALREQDEMVIIVPCQENGELDFVKNDEFLKDFAIRNDEICRNILSPARAKGLEYDRVLLYGFGAEATRQVPLLMNYIDSPEKQPPEVEQRLAWEYFLNQFYVAASRARKRLFIADSPESFTKFWTFTNPEFQKQLMGLYGSKEYWGADHIGGIAKGEVSSWLDDRDDPLVLANQFYEQGRAHRDPHLLSLARNNFELAKRPEQAKLCDAEHYEYAQDFKKAAELFASLGQLEAACRCYWSDQNYESLVALAVNFPEIAREPKYICASALIREANSASQIESVLSTLEKIEPAPFPDSPGDVAAWQSFFHSFLVKIESAIQSTSHKREDWVNFINRIIATIKRFELPLHKYPDLAKLLYVAGHPDTALQYWTEHCAGKTTEPKDSPWLQQARAATAVYPDCIKAYFDLGDHQGAINAWRKAGETVSFNLPVNILFDSAYALKDFDAVLKLLPVVTNLKKVLKVFEIHSPHDIQNLLDALPVAIFRALESARGWGDMVKFATTQTTPDSELNAAIKKAGFVWQDIDLLACAVRVLARSEHLAKEKPKSQSEISRFLRKNLVIDNDASRADKDHVRAVLNKVSIYEAGAALERAFRLVFALDFYEQFIIPGSSIHRLLNPSPQEEEFAKRRWLHCKRRLANMPSKGPDNKHLKDAEEWAGKWSIRADKEPEIPELNELVLEQSQTSGGNALRQDVGMPVANDSVTKNQVKEPKETHQITIESSIRLDDFQLNAKILTRKMRVILTDEASDNQVTCGPDGVTSDDLQVSQIEYGTDTRSVWQIPQWNLGCEIDISEKNVVIRFRYADGSSILGFEFLSD